MIRKGPGLLLRDILKGEDPQIDAVVATIARLDADLLLLTGIDYDHGQVALAALEDRLEAAGSPYPHLFAARPNAGMATGLDMDGDGRRGEPEDAQSYGWFAGQGGMALLSRHPIAADRVRNFSGLLWRDLPGARLPVDETGAPFPSVEARAALRLSTIGHWDVPVLLPDGATLRLLAFHASSPVFDGPEDRNGLRNADEIRFWQVYLDGALDETAPPETGFVVLGRSNLDPADGDGRRAAIHGLLGDPRLQDPAPRSTGAVRKAAADGGVNASHRGDPALDTADWGDGPEDPGNLRVDVVLPSSDWMVAGAGVAWPAPGAPQASRSAPVWVDLSLPTAAPLDPSPPGG